MGGACLGQDLKKPEAGSFTRAGSRQTRVEAGCLILLEEVLADPLHDVSLIHGYTDIALHH